jgi:hypothetical protein
MNNLPIGVGVSDLNLTTGWGINGVPVTATAAELNKLRTVTATAAEISSLSDEVASVNTSGVNNTGSNAVQFVFKNAAGATISGVRGMMMFVSTSVGVLTTAVTSVATLTNGVVATLVTGQVAFVNPSAAGLLGVTLTMTTGNYYLSFVLPNGKVITSTVLAT